MGAAAGELVLAERPQGHSLDPPGQGFGNASVGAQLRGTGEQESAGPLVTVDACLDRKQQVRHVLDFVDRQQPWSSRDETSGVGECGCASRDVVE